MEFKTLTQEQVLTLTANSGPEILEVIRAFEQGAAGVVIAEPPSKLVHRLRYYARRRHLNKQIRTAPAPDGTLFYTTSKTKLGRPKIATPSHKKKKAPKQEPQGEPDAELA